MSGEDRTVSEKEKGVLSLVPKRSSIVFLGIGLVVTAAAWALNRIYPEPPSTAEISLGWSGWTRLALVVLGAVMGGVALRTELGRHKGKGWPQFPESATAAVVCVLLAQIMLFAGHGLVGEASTQPMVSNDNTGDVITWNRPGQMQSLGFVCRAGMICAYVGGFLLVIPEVARRVFLVGSLTFHFCGILSAVLSVPPPNGNAPWLVSQAWTHVYRPYLLFIYQNNAYHFYSPEPGPPSFLWLQITYTDGGKRWFRLPDTENSPTPMHFQRMLSIGESASSAVQREAGAFRSEAVIQKMAQLLGLEKLPRGTIEPITWREPMPNAKHLMCSYVRSLMSRFPHPEGNPEANILEGHLWRVVHSIIQPGEIAIDGRDGSERRYFVTIYQGEYNEKGSLQDPNDPLLYWMLQAYDRKMIQQLAVQAAERETEVRRLRDLRVSDQTSAAENAVMVEEADALKRFQGMLQIWLKEEAPVIDFFKLQSETTKFPPVSVWAEEANRTAKLPPKAGAAKKPVDDKAKVGIRGAGEAKP